MAITIAIQNQKGGVAKTTTAAALAAGLQLLKGYKTLLVDLDAQANLTYTAGATQAEPTALSVLTGKVKAADAIQHTAALGDIIAANETLLAADNVLTSTGKEYKLKEALEGIQGLYDFIILDTPPALSEITTNALTASDYIIIPTQADIYSINGIRDLAANIADVRKYCNSGLKIAGILLTRYNPRAILTKELTGLAENIAGSIGTEVYQARIREAVVIKEAQLSQENIFTYAPKANVTSDYKAFIEETLQKISKGAGT